MNINNPTTFGSPDLTLSTSNSSGTGGALRADDTILVYDTTVPTTIASAASANTGDTATAARRNHTHGMLTVTAQSSQAALEAETDEDTYAPPDRIKYSPGVAKVWCHITSAGTLSSPDYGVSTVVDNETGNRTINFSVAFSSIYYAPGSTPTYNNTGVVVRNDTLATGSVRQVVVSFSTGFQVDYSAATMVMGDQ